MRFDFSTKTMLAAIALAATLVGCGGGETSASGPKPALTTTTLKVVVLDDATVPAPIKDARVRFAGTDLMTDATGAVTATLPNSDTETLALITKTGFATNAKTAVVYSGKASELRVTLFAHQNVSNFAANAGISVTPGGAKIDIPAAAGFRTAAGVTYTGIVTISSSYFNPETVRGIQGFAEPYVGAVAGTQTSLVSLGVIEAKFTAADGSALEMTNVAAATLTFPATSNSRSQSNVPLWFYDEAAKIWVREGLAQRMLDGSYVGTVTHFTLWNLDRQFTNPATLNVCFRNAQNQPISPIFATLSGIGWSNNLRVGADGNLQIIRIPTGQALELRGTNPVFAPISIPALADNESRDLPCVVLAGPATSFTQTPVTTVPAVTSTGSAGGSAGTTTTPNVSPTTPTVTPTTPTETSTTPVVSPTVPTVTQTTPTVSPTVPTVTQTTPTTTASFAGLYSGNYSGNEIGAFNVVISSAGVVSGTAISQTFMGLNSTVSGQVGSTGQVSLTATGTAGAAVFSGAINASGEVFGTWRYSGAAGGGTFSGRRI